MARPAGSAAGWTQGTQAMMTVGILLLAWGLVGLLTAALAAAGRTRAHRHAERRSHTPQACRWLARHVTAWGDGHSVVAEECARCLAMRVVVRKGIWIFNRFRELVNAGDVTALGEMLRG